MRTFKTAPTIKIPTLNNNLESTTRVCKLSVKDGVLFCADYEALDYYGEYRGGLPWICEELEKFATKLGGYWEWETPESISLVF